MTVEMGRVNPIVCHEAREGQNVREGSKQDGLGGLARQGDRGYRQGHEERQTDSQAEE